MFINTSGEVTLDSQYTSTNEEINENSILYTIKDFNLDSFRKRTLYKGQFYGKFNEIYVSAFAPITNAFVMKGYVVVHLPESIIAERVNTTFNTNYMTWLTIILLNLSFIIIYIINVHKPAKVFLLLLQNMAKVIFLIVLE